MVLLFVVAGSVLIFAIATTIFFIRRTYKRKVSAYFSSKDKSRELEDASVYFGASVFSYAELQDATQHFNSSKELGDGGFGTVYYGNDLSFKHRTFQIFRVSLAYTCASPNFIYQA
ncbi:putative non-specific serine/threonine protein kinase [Helianthus annuus]|nr:putative non-specific serine/threonine protein kinase [Helianthus annuus]